MRDPADGVVAPGPCLRIVHRWGWPALAVWCGRRVAALSRWAGRGGGSIVGGRVTLALYPRALSWLAAGRRVVLVSGTNGKTTTSHMIASALRTRGLVAHNASGSNMADGAVAALAAAPGAGYAVLEIDELHLAAVAPECDPRAVVLLNLTRDQLDRSAEVRAIAANLGATLARLPGATVFANADDPMVVWAAGQAAGPVTWVAAGSTWSGDTATCPCCGWPLSGSVPAEQRGQAAAGWRCGCGLAAPVPDWWLDGRRARSRTTQTELALALPGGFNLGNALMALAVARHEAIAPPTAGPAIESVDDVAGRYRRVMLSGRTARLLLAKNPAGWAAALSVLDQPRPMVITVNAREADGRDTSWLWDVDFGSLRGRPVVASGERAADLGVRLSYAEVEHTTAPDPLIAVRRLPPGEVDLVGNYTAFHDVLRLASGTGSAR